MQRKCSILYYFVRDSDKREKCSPGYDIPESESKLENKRIG